MRRRGGLDVEVEKVTEEVQKGLENMSDWTLKQWESKQSPNGMRKHVGLDVEAVGKQAKVQTE